MAASAPSPSKLQCIMCPRQFPGVEDLQCHIAGEHLDYFPVGCGHCNTWLPAESMLTMHVSRRGHAPYKAKFMRDQHKEAQLSAIMKQITGTGATPRQPLQQQQQSEAETSAFKPPNQPTLGTASATVVTQKTPQKPTTSNATVTAADIQQLEQADNKIKYWQGFLVLVQKMGPDEALQSAKKCGLSSGDALLVTVQAQLRDAQAHRARIVASMQQMQQQQSQKPKSAPRPRAPPKTEGGAAKGRKRKSDSVVDVKTSVGTAPANTPPPTVLSGVPCRPASTAPATAIAPPTTVAPQQTSSEALQSVAAPPVATTPQPATIESVGSVTSSVAEKKGSPMPSIENTVGMPSLMPQAIVSDSAVGAQTSAETGPANILVAAPAVPSGVLSRPASTAPSETPTPVINIAPQTTVAPQQTMLEQLQSVAAPAVVTVPQPVIIESVGSVPCAVAEMPSTLLPSIEDTFGKPSLMPHVFGTDSAYTALANTLAPAPGVPSGVPFLPASTASSEAPTLTTAIAPPTIVAPQQTPIEQLQSVAAPPVAMAPQSATIESVGSVPCAVAEMPSTLLPSIADTFGRPPLMPHVFGTDSAYTALANTIFAAPGVPSGVPCLPASTASSEAPTLTTAIAPPTIVAPQQTPFEQLQSVAAPAVAMAPHPATIGSVPNLVAEMPITPVTSMEDNGKPSLMPPMAASDPSLSTDGSC